MPNNEKKVIENAFIGRTDGYVDNGCDYSNPIQETWILKDVVVRTGDGEDDWYLDKKPFKTGEIDLDAQIHEQAKGTDLRSLVAQCVRTGDVDLVGLNQKQGSYVDITGYPDNTIDALNAIRDGNTALNKLPDELKAKGVENVINITKDEIQAMIDKAIGKVEATHEETKSDIQEVKEDIK